MRHSVSTANTAIGNDAPDTSALSVLCIFVSNQFGRHSMDDKLTKPATPVIEIVTLKQLCTELKLAPREARERLRLAVRDVKKNPELAKSHKPGHTWEWPKNSPALKEVRTALTS
jgi:hypothetical protein